MKQGEHEDLAASETIRRASRRNRKRLLRAAARAFRPTVISPAEVWCPASVTLSSDVEASSGNYDITNRPWWKAILACFNDPEVQSVSVPASTQVGKTLTLLSLLLYIAENMPAPTMVVLPDQTAAVEFRDRVYASAAITAKQCSKIRVPPVFKWNNRYIDLGSMRIYLAWSGSRQRLRGRPCRYVFLSETDAYRSSKKTGNAIEAAHQRTKAFFRHLWYHESSPSGYPSEIVQLERGATARYRWHAICPHCGHAQEVRFFVHKSGPYAGKGGVGGLRNEKTTELVDEETARRKAHYICEKGCVIESLHKRQFMETGDWKSLGEVKSRRSVGFHLWEFFSETISFGDTAAKFIRAREEGKLPEFFGNSLGLEYEPERRVPEWEQLRRRLAFTHTRGQVPPDAWFLTSGIDKQADHNGVRFVVRAWAPHRTSWLIDWGYLERVPGDENDLVKSDLTQLRQAVLERSYAVLGINPLGKAHMRVRLSGIDSNHLPRAIHEWMRTLPESWVSEETARIRAVRGDHKVSPELRFRKNIVEQNHRTGEVYEGGLEQWGICVYPYYDEQLQALNSDPGKPGAWYVAADADKQYLQQVCNFGPKFKWTNGKKKFVWEEIHPGIPVDFWDCEIYARVMAEMVVGNAGWTPEAWEREFKPNTRQRPTRPAAKPQQGAEDLDVR